MTRPLEMAAHHERTDHQGRADFWLGYLLGGISVTAFVVVAVLGSKLWG